MLLLLDNYDSFTWNLVQRLGEIDPSLDIHVVRNDRITAEQALALNPTHVVISPGPCSPVEAGVSNDIIRAFAGRVPVLGVCLGHQCIGATHGMTVARHARLMHGKTSPIHHDDKGIFAGLSNPFTATRYHSLVVLRGTVPPAGWEVSAWTRETLDDGAEHDVIMGLRRVWPTNNAADSERGAASTDRVCSGGAPLDGVQFHPESFLTTEGPKLLANFLASAVRTFT